MKLYSLLLVSLLSSIPALAFAQDAPKSAVVSAKATNAGGVAHMIELQGVITAIDSVTRIVSIKGGSGQEYKFEAGPEVKNFDQAKVGDIVTVSYLEAIALELKKTKSGLREKSEKIEVVRAKPGEKPAAEITKRVSVVADVTAIDAANKKISLRGPKETVEILVKDPAMLKGIKVGDQVEGRYIAGVAVTLTAVK